MEATKCFLFDTDTRAPRWSKMHATARSLSGAAWSFPTIRNGSANAAGRPGGPPNLSSVPMNREPNPGSPVFDTKVLAMSVMSMEEYLETRGWDQLPQVMALYRAEDLNIAGTLEGQIGLGYQLLGEGDPYEILLEEPLEEAAVGLLVSVEGWSFPSDLPQEQRHGPPSEHPDKVEVRFAILCPDDRTKGNLFLRVARNHGWLRTPQRQLASNTIVL